MEKNCDVKMFEEKIKNKQDYINSLKLRIEMEEEELLQMKNQITILRHSKKSEVEKKPDLKPIPVAITHTPKNSKNYQDEVTNQEAIKYYFDDQGIDAKYIEIGAHFYSRPNNKQGFIYQGIVSEISATHHDEDGIRKYCYLKIDNTVKSSIGELNPGDKVPEISPGGRGSTKYMRDAAHFAGITPLKKAYFHGIMH